VRGGLTLELRMFGGLSIKDDGAAPTTSAATPRALADPAVSELVRQLREGSKKARARRGQMRRR